MSTKEAVSATELPSHCRTWDSKRRVWVPKTRYATEAEAKAANGKNRTMSAYRCKASSVGVHFHLGHPSKGKRR